MKKNFSMWVVTFFVAIFGFVLAIIAFFKKRHFFWRFKNEKDIFNDLGDEDDEKLNFLQDNLNDAAESSDESKQEEKEADSNKIEVID